MQASAQPTPEYANQTKPLPRIVEVRREPNPLKKLIKLLGPGFITGVADDDPSSIGTYAVAGASLGLATLWTAVLTFPFLAGVQNICARIGMVSGMGVAGVIRRRFPVAILYPAVIALLIANTITIGADLAAIGDALRIFFNVPPLWLILPVAIAVVALQVFAGYQHIATVFKIVSFVLFAYVIDAFAVKGVNLRQVVHATLVPTLSLDKQYLTTLVAIVGTVVSPYIFFWQSNQEVEEERAAGRATVRERRGARRIELRYRNIDINIGMAATNLIMFFIIFSTAVTLHAHGVTQVETGAQAAQALEPLAGHLAGVLFAAGMIGTGVLAVPILAASSAYALAEAFRWPSGLDKKWWQAKGFYAVIVTGVVAGAAMNAIGINAIAALFWSSVLNGVVAPPLLVLIMLVARDQAIMGVRRLGPLLTTLGWLTVLALSATVIALFLAT
jgi:NRAMP (natural resistance-associated macrophage protein)-like metal ion transporter